MTLSSEDHRQQGSADMIGRASRVVRAWDQVLPKDSNPPTWPDMAWHRSKLKPTSLDTATDRASSRFSGLIFRRVSVEAFAGIFVAPAQTVLRPEASACKCDHVCTKVTCCVCVCALVCWGCLRRLGCLSQSQLKRTTVSDPCTFAISRPWLGFGGSFTEAAWLALVWTPD